MFKPKPGALDLDIALADQRVLGGGVALSHLKRLNLLTGRSEITVEGLRSRAFLHLLFHRVRHFLLGFAMARPERSNILVRRREICYGSRALPLSCPRGCCSP